MAKNDIGGVWRTVGGRRIFIKDGQDLASAMKESGKFKTTAKANEDKAKREAEFEKNIDEMYNRFHGKTDKQIAEEIAKERGERLLTDKEQKEREVQFMKNLEKEVENANRTPEEKETAYKTRDVKDYQDEKGRWHINDTAKNEIDKEVSMMSGKDLKEAYNSLEKNDNSYEARAIRGEYNQRQVNEEKFHKTTQNMIKSSGSSDDSFTMTNGSREVTVSKDDSGKWVDSDGNKYMGYLSKSDVKSYFKGDWREAKTSESSKTEAKNYMQDQFKAFDKGNISGADLEKAKRDSGLSKQEIEEARNYVNNRAPESYPRQTENKTGKTTSQAVPKTSNKDFRKQMADADTWEDIHKAIDSIDNDYIKDYVSRSAQKLEENENGAWKSASYLSKDYTFYEKEYNKEKNDWVRNAFNDYKKEHPNTKMTFETFKKSKK